MKLQYNNAAIRYLQPTSIFRYLVTPSALLLLYTACLILLLSAFVTDPKNVNRTFSTDLFGFSLLILVPATCLWLIMRKKAPARPGLMPEQLKPLTYLVVSALPITPIIHYLISNADVVSAVDILVILAGFFSASFLFVFIVPLLVSKHSSPRLLVSLSNAFVFTIFNMAAVSSSQSWYGEGDIIIQFGLFTLTSLATWFLLRLRSNRDMAFVVAVFMVGNMVLSFMAMNNELPTDESGIEATPENRLAKFVTGKQAQATPNIYLLVYDSYVPNETMMAYGIDNADQEYFLIERGFTLYPYTYSVAASSLASMNRTLNVSEISQDRIGVNGNGAVQNVLRSLGYRIVGLFGTDFFFQVNGPQYDYHVPGNVPGYLPLTKGILSGEFRFDIGQDRISHSEYVRAKRDFFADPSETPLFVYAHSLVPGHSQNSGVCLPDETELYVEDLHTANKEMRHDIETIIKADNNAIIIVAGDHGPYLTKNCFLLHDYPASEINRLDIQDRFGAFLAVRWPDESYSNFDQIRVLQDVFPAVFAWMYRDETALDTRIEPVTVKGYGYGPDEVYVRDGVIVGGPDDGQPLFLSAIP